MQHTLAKNPNRARAPIAVGVTVGIALVIAGCSNGGRAKTGGETAATGSATSATSGSTTSAPLSAPSTGVNPNGPEVNQAGDIPDNQVFVDYTPPTGRFSVTVPEGWARSESGGTVLFTDKLNSVRLQTSAAPTAPTVASVTGNDLPAIREASSHFEAGTVRMVTRRAGPAVLAIYRADAPPDPVTGKVVHDDVERYEFWQAGTAVVITLSGSQGADNVDPWRIITDSFRWR